MYLKLFIFCSFIIPSDLGYFRDCSYQHKSTLYILSHKQNTQRCSSPPHPGTDRSLARSCKFVRSPDRAYGLREPNGTWTGLNGLVHRGVSGHRCVTA